MISGKERTPLSLTCLGDDVRMSSDFEGKSMDIAIVNEKIYLINNDAQTYMILNSLVASTMGIDIDELQSGNFAFELAPASTATREKTVFNGREADKFTVGAGSGMMDVYVVDGKIERFEKSGSDPNSGAVYELNSFTDQVSAEDIEPDPSFKKQNMLAFFSSMM